MAGERTPGGCCCPTGAPPPPPPPGGSCTGCLTVAGHYCFELTAQTPIYPFTLYNPIRVCAGQYGVFTPLLNPEVGVLGVSIVAPGGVVCQLGILTLTSRCYFAMDGCPDLCPGAVGCPEICADSGPVLLVTSNEGFILDPGPGHIIGGVRDLVNCTITYTGRFYTGTGQLFDLLTGVPTFIGFWMAMVGLNDPPPQVPSYVNPATVQSTTVRIVLRYAPCAAGGNDGCTESNALLQPAGSIIRTDATDCSAVAPGKSMQPAPIILPVPVLPAPIIVTGGRVVIADNPVPVVEILAPVVTTSSAGGALAAPGGLDSTPSLPAPTITTGARATPVAVDVAPVVLSPVFTSGQSVVVTPSPVDSAPALPAPTLKGGAVVVAPVMAIMPPPTLPVPVVKTGAKAAPAVLDPGAPTLPAPQIGAGSAVRATPGPLDSTPTLPAPVVTGGAKVAPSPVDSTPTLPAPVVTGDVLVTCCTSKLRRTLPVVTSSADCPCAETVTTMTWDDALGGWAFSYAACGHTLRITVACNQSTGAWEIGLTVDGLAVPFSAGFVIETCASLNRRGGGTADQFQFEVAIPDALTGAGNTCHVYVSAG